MRGNIVANKTNVFQGGKPEEAVKWIIDNCIATNTTLIMGVPGSPSAVILRTFFDPKMADTFKFTFLEGEQLWNTILSVFSGPLLSYIYQCIDRDYYEVFFDTETEATDSHIIRLPSARKLILSKTMFQCIPR